MWKCQCLPDGEPADLCMCRPRGALEAEPAYTYENPSRFTLADCEAVVGRRATITLTGYIVEADESNTGPFVRFQPDDRFGFGDFRFGIDLDALTVSARKPTGSDTDGPAVSEKGSPND